MKKLLFYLFLVTSMLLFSTCDGSGDNNCEDTLWDFANYEILFTAIDADGGGNLFDANNPNNLLNDGVWITFRDKTYNIVDWTYPEGTTRATYVRPFALRYYPANKVPSYFPSQTMGFGEFGPSNYNKEPFTIHWADGSTDLVQLDCYLTWKDCEPTVHKALYLNGKLVSDNSYPTLQFVKGRKKAE